MRFRVNFSMELFLFNIPLTCKTSKSATDVISTEGIISQKNKIIIIIYLSTAFPQSLSVQKGGDSERTSYDIRATSRESAEEEEATQLHSNCQLQTHDWNPSVSPPSCRKGRKQSKHGVGAAVGVGGDGPSVL